MSETLVSSDPLTTERLLVAGGMLESIFSGRLSRKLFLHLGMIGGVGFHEARWATDSSETGIRCWLFARMKNAAFCALNLRDFGSGQFRASFVYRVRNSEKFTASGCCSVIDLSLARK